NGTNLPSPSFLSTNTALVELYADNNSWTSVYELRNHSALEILSLSNNAISDPSPLYILSGTLTSLDLTENLICGTNVGTSIDGKLGGTSGVVSYSFKAGSSCECDASFSTTDMLSKNLVCSETKPNSGHWYAICASDSYTTYTDADTFTCTQATSATSNCVGGCAFGEECRNLLSNGLETEGSCETIIPDDILFDCLIDILPSSFIYDGTFGVASLVGLNETIETFECQYVSNMLGIHHLTNIISLDLSNSALDDLSPLSNFSNLSSFVLDGSSSISLTCSSLLSSSPLYLSLNNVSLTESNISDLSLFSSLESISLRNSGLTEIPDLSLSGDSLRKVDISNNNVKSLGHIYTYSLLNIEELDVSSNIISDISPIFALRDSLLSLNLSGNQICGLDDNDEVSSMKSIFSVFIEDPDLFTINISSQDTSSCSNCSNSPSISGGTVCTEVWDNEWQSTCADSTFVDYASNSCMSFIALDDEMSSLPIMEEEKKEFVQSIASLCLSEKINNPRTICVRVDDLQISSEYPFSVQDSSLFFSSIQSLSSLPIAPAFVVSCINGWYGHDCTRECGIWMSESSWTSEYSSSETLDAAEERLFELYQCGGESRGTCDVESHSCECSLGYDGTACSELACVDEQCGGSGQCLESSSVGSTSSTLPISSDFIFHHSSFSPSQVSLFNSNISSYVCLCPQESETIYYDDSGAQYCASKCNEGIGCGNGSCQVNDNDVWECSCDSSSQYLNPISKTCIMTLSVCQNCEHGKCLYSQGMDEDALCYCEHGWAGETCDISLNSDWWLWIQEKNGWVVFVGLFFVLMVVLGLMCVLYFSLVGKSRDQNISIVENAHLDSIIADLENCSQPHLQTVTPAVIVVEQDRDVFSSPSEYKKIVSRHNSPSLLAAAPPEIE
ncbi:hypothetical protein ADUPG1_006915, partial [Aduncisulcus paluster]